MTRTMNRHASHPTAFSASSAIAEPQNSSYTRVFVMGDTSLLGVKADESKLTTPRLCSYNILIKEVACGERHTHLLT